MSKVRVSQDIHMASFGVKKPRHYQCVDSRLNYSRCRLGGIARKNARRAGIRLLDIPKLK